MKEIVIGLAGLSFASKNLGCAALAVSFYRGLVELLQQQDADKKYRIISFSAFPRNYADFADPAYPVQFVEYHLSRIDCVIHVLTAIRKCDCIIDFTEGDSFSDIYGSATFVRSSFTKVCAILTHARLILGPQTYGPYSHILSRKIAKFLIEHADTVCARDAESKTYLELLGVRHPVGVYTDVAYLLPYRKTAKDPNAPVQVGINVSELLWKPFAETHKKFGLTVDYKMYIRKLIQALLARGAYRVVLIPHVGEKGDPAANDYTACAEVKAEFEECTLLNGFSDPIAAKTTIAQMDAFVGARMHATIGAFSAGVLSIPFAYSKKFSGYYDRLDYPLLIEGRSLTTEQAVDKTLSYIRNRKSYADAQKASMRKSQECLAAFYGTIGRTITGERL